MKKSFLILFLLFLGFAAAAQQTVPAKTRVLIVLDGSRSMCDLWQSDSKIKVVQRTLGSILDSLAAQTELEVALRLYNHKNPNADGTMLEVPFEADNIRQLQSKLRTVVPGDGSSATQALYQSFSDFPDEASSRNILFLITDGLSSADGNLCGVMRQLQQRGTAVRLFILGPQTSADAQPPFSCAESFTYLPTEEQFDRAMHQSFGNATRMALVTLALTDGHGAQYETTVPVLFYDHQSRQLRYSTIHHYEGEWRADTLQVDPLYTYDLTFATKPPVRLTHQQFAAGQANEVKFRVAQGTLRLHYEARRSPFPLPDYQVVVRNREDGQIVSHQSVDVTAAYLAGHYDIEVLTQPVVTIPNVEIQEGSTTDLQLPLPGQLALEKPKESTFGSIFVVDKEVLRWVCDLHPAETSERITLLPGEYQVVLKSAAANGGPAASEHFIIKAGQQTGITLTNSKE